MSRIHAHRRRDAIETIKLPSQFKESARQMVDALTEGDAGSAVKLVGSRHVVEVSPELSSVLSHLLQNLLENGAVSLVPIERNLSTFEAAEMLGVSRPYLIKDILERGLIPYEQVGTRGDRRIKLTDVLAFRALRDTERSRALDDLAQLDAEFMVTDFGLPKPDAANGTAK